MSEAHPRNAMEGNWNGDVSWPVECLLNGMNASDPHNMIYTNGNTHSGHNILPAQFRHRFQTQPTQPPLHLSTTGLPLTSSINVSIPSHPMVEDDGGELHGDGDGTGQDTRHDMGQSIPMRTNNVLGDTDDASDEDEEEDAVDDMEQDALRIRRQNALSQTHQMENALMCQQQVSVRDNLSTMIPMQESHPCHPKMNSNVILRTNNIAISEHSMQPHQHQSAPPPMMPMFQQTMDEYAGSDSIQSQEANGDPNTGFSVYGKMYFEGRIVLHLKQGDGTGSNSAMNFSSCGEAASQKGPHFEGCAMCRLNHRRRADSHRHAIRGVLFTFEDCTIVELYPEQLNVVPNNNSNEIKPTDQGSKICLPNGHGLMNPYLTNPLSVPHSSAQGDHVIAKQRIMQQQQHLETEQLSVHRQQNSQQHQQASSPLPQPQQQPAKTNEDHSWWDEFESEAEGDDELKETDTTDEELSNQGPDVSSQPAPCLSHKLNDASATGPLGAEQSIFNNNEENQDHQLSDDEISSSYVKYKCSLCSSSFMSSALLNSHICLNHSTLSQTSNTSGTSSVSSGIPPPPAIELDLSSSSSEIQTNNSSNCFETNNTSMEMEDNSRTVTTPTLTELENNVVQVVPQNRNDLLTSDAEDDSCHSSLDIVSSQNGNTSCANEKVDENKRPNSPHLQTPGMFLDDLNQDHNGKSPTECQKEEKYQAKYPCSICNKGFYLKKNLKQHMKASHTGLSSSDELTTSNSGKCLKCGNEFKENLLKSHKCASKHSSIVQGKRKGVKSIRKREKRTELARSPSHSHNKDGSGNFSEGDSNNTKKKKFSSRKFQQTYAGDFYFPNGINDSLSQGAVPTDLSTNNEFCSSNSNQDEYEDQNELELPNFRLIKSKTTKVNQKRSLRTEAKFKQKSRTSAKNKAFKCDACNKCFSVERRLENHKHSHCTEKSSQCEKCGKRFARRDKLLRHMFVHNEEKMFACDICDKRFSRKDKLTDHLKSHNKADETHRCPMCKKEFLRPDILKQHVKLHGMDDKHQCPDCLRFVTGKERLEKHMARHEEAKALGQTLLCPLCTKYFIQRQSLKAHVKKFHPDANISIDMQVNGPDSNFTGLQAQTMHCSQLQPLGASNNATENISNHFRASGTLTSISISNNGEFKAFSNGATNPNSSSPSNNENDSTLAVLKSGEIYPCRQCPKTFTKKLSLRKHQRKHQQHEESSSRNNNNSILCTPQGTDTEEPASNLLESVMDNNTNSTQNMNHSSNILLSLASQIVNSSPLSSNSVSPPVQQQSIESNSPSPSHGTILSAQHPPTPPQCSQLNLSSLQQHHHNQVPGLSSATVTAPPAHMPLSLTAAVSAASPISQQSNLLGMSGQNTHPTLHPGSHHILQHSHHASSPGLGHAGLSCSHGQMHPHLSQHISVSPLQHMNVGMTPPQSMFYYSHYSYQ